MELVGNAHPTCLMAAGAEARPTFTIKAVGRPSPAARRIHPKGEVRALAGTGKCADYPLSVHPET